METSLESKSIKAEGEILTGFAPELSSFETREYVKAKSYVSESARYHAKTSAGLITIVALAALPFFILPGLAIVILLAEIYVIDWTYSNFTSSRNRKAESKDVEKAVDSQDLEKERSKIASTTSAKDQFIK
ncbi:MAG: hypothetical protein ACFFEF_06515 [Candidatus Thorarchaeota archaeon]